MLHLGMKKLFQSGRRFSNHSDYQLKWSMMLKTWACRVGESLRTGLAKTGGVALVHLTKCQLESQAVQIQKPFMTLGPNFNFTKILSSRIHPVTSTVTVVDS